MPGGGSDGAGTTTIGIVVARCYPGCVGSLHREGND